MKYVKQFLLRGMIFGGFGPVITALILYILSMNIDVTLNGKEILVVIFSTYLLAFVHAGSSVFNQIENWSISKSLTFHLTSLYLAYLSCYLINSWIPFDWTVILIFTLTFIVVYFIVWSIVYLIVRNTTKKLNENI